MSKNELIKRNHEIGHEYLKLAKDADILARKYEKLKVIEDMSWDFGKYHDLYTKISNQFQIIGKKLTELK